MKPAAQASLLTPQSPSGIAVLSLSGADSQEVIRRLFRPARTGRSLPSPSRAAYGFVERGGEILDEVLLICTGRQPPAYEICCHGGESSARAILEALSAQGGEVIPWSGLIEKKTLHHALLSDLLQSEGPNQAVLLAHLHGGVLHDAFSTLENALRSLEPGQPPLKRDELDRALHTAAALEETYPRARFLRRPARVILSGPPNAGKSTLFNALLGERRALTSKIPGTTRDPVEASFLLDGFPVRLFDLPGSGRRPGRDKEGASKIDDEAMAVANQLALDADLFLHVLDLQALNLNRANRGHGLAVGSLPPFMARREAILIFNKMDLLEAGETAFSEALIGQGATRPVKVSALKQDGLPKLLATMSRVLGFNRLKREKTPLLVNKHQVALVRAVRDALRGGRRNEHLLLKLNRYLS